MLGQSGKPWEFLALSAKALAQAPGDEGLRFLTAANLARLGFATSARAHLGLLTLPAAEHPDISALSRALSGLPSDAMTPRQAIETCRANAQVLAQRGIDLAADLAAWNPSAQGALWLRSLDGLVYRADAGPWIPTCGDVRSLARTWVRGLAADQFAEPCVIEGLDPPWALLETWNATRSTPLGHSPRITLVQRETRQFLDALASCDLRHILGDERIDILLGPHAGGRLGPLLSSRSDQRLPKAVFTTPGTRDPGTPAVGLSVQLALNEQAREHVRLRERVNRLYAPRGEAHWAERFRGALAGGRRLRILLPTCRFSTFVRHSAGDLAAALARAGHEARILIEPDAHSNLSSIAYLRAFAEFEPDLVILFNHPRGMMGDSIPANVPYVCWVQDAMPHLFADGARYDGPLDFWLGHVYRELFERHACRVDHSLPFPVVADAAKFHPGPAPSAAQERFACEVACVTHHSETPRAMHARLAAEIERTAPGITPTLDALRDRIEAVVALAAAKNLHSEIERATGEALREALSREPDPAMRTILLRAYAVPLADRMLRHETFRWAAEICGRRGWRLRLYGKGWDTHPTLSKHAAGELSHGEELRAAYQCAAVHLHVSATTLVHQRVLECLLSGGLCIPRVHADALSPASAAALYSLIDADPDVIDSRADRVGYTIARRPSAASLAGLKAAFDLPVEGGTLWVRRAKLQGLAHWRHLHLPEQDPAWLFVDLPEVGFHTRERLERVLDRAINDTAWRAGVIAHARANVLDRLTHDALVPRILSLIADALSPAAQAAEAA